MDLKLEQVTAAIVERLNISCEECGRENIIGSEFFFCYPESPSFLTYRARLKGTSETDRGSLVLLIEAWVRRRWSQPHPDWSTDDCGLPLLSSHL